MKRILSALALGAVLSLSIAATPAGGNKTSENCSADHDIELSEDLTATALDYKKLEGQLYNNSDTKSYDDVVVQVNYYSDSNEMIGTESIKVNKDIEPGEVEDISLAFNAPEDASHATWNVVCAEDDHSLTDTAKSGGKKGYEKVKDGAGWTYKKGKFWG